MTDNESWAWEKNHGFDTDNHELREACHGVAECPVCGKDVELIAETEIWTETEKGSGKWAHSEFGPAAGVCCNKLIFDYWDGCFVYDLPTPADG